MLPPELFDISQKIRHQLFFADEKIRFFPFTIVAMITLAEVPALKHRIEHL